MNLKNSLLIIFILNFSSLFAQDLWKIEYEVYDKIFFDDADKQIQDDLKQNNARPKFYAFLFDTNQSFFSEIERINNNQNNSSISMSMSTIDNNIYIDYQSKEFKIEGNYANKKFLVKDNLPQYNWIIQREKKEISGIKVTKATLNYENTDIEAWFASDIQPKGGPVYFNGLPGLILELKSYTKLEGERYETTFTLIKIDKASQNEKIVVPSKGTVMTEKEKMEFIKEANKKMMETYQNKVDKD